MISSHRFIYNFFNQYYTLRYKKPTKEETLEDFFREQHCYMFNLHDQWIDGEKYLQEVV